LESLTAILRSVKFFSFQADGSTDKAVIEQELYTVQCFDPKTDDGVVHVRNQYLCVRQLQRGRGACLLRSSQQWNSLVSLIVGKLSGGIERTCSG